LRSLPVTCIFNVVGFGTTFDHIFKESVAYSEESLATALKYASCKKLK
jgi:hypothetical protein